MNQVYDFNCVSEIKRLKWLTKVNVKTFLSWIHIVWKKLSRNNLDAGFPGHLLIQKVNSYVLNSFHYQNTILQFLFI